MTISMASTPMASTPNRNQTITSAGNSIASRFANRMIQQTIGHLLTGVLLLFCLSGTIELYGRAQSGAAETPAPPPRAQGQNPNGMHIYIWAGLKSHLPGQHDYPQFLADWSKILTERGAVVDGALHAPSAADLEHTDVVIIYKGDAGYLIDSERPVLESFVKRGGGLVNFHDSLCGPEPDYLATLLGGAKKHGEVNYTLDAPIHYNVVDQSDPIMKDMSDITILDEAFFKVTWAKNPAIHVLATTAIPATHSAGDHKGEIVPQIWTYEHTPAGGRPLEPLFGCRATSTLTLPITRFSEHCFAASPGRPINRSMSL